MRKFLFREVQKGFTLIELMVVVAIIGILMSAGILAFSNAQQNARDSKRRADIDAISKTLEQYNQSDNGNYPSSNSAEFRALFPTGAMPTDPQGGAYTLTFVSGKYCVCARLEKAGKGNADTAGAGGLCSYTAGDYFCASQRQ